ncbi:CheR family methyltransferase [Hymenobacter busanensis]|nr:CheR family methyltransferase [Hymenobacter busanensis]QHJ08975.1 PAS domain-containing protein [Hymenobacter busanensis]
MSQTPNPPSETGARTQPETVTADEQFPHGKVVEIRPLENQGERHPVVALCASAGGLEALERFFQYMPPDSGLAFVVVMHLDPDGKDMLPDVLARFTPMPVQRAEDGLKVKPNHVYCIPPDRDMSILHGTLLLLPPTQPRGRRMPIDYFLQSLAKDSRERAVCIIFSGAGSDGTIGLKMVMENFGMVMVQEPDSAAFDSMPRSALNTEFVDQVLLPEQMPAVLLDYVRRPLLAARPEPEDPDSTTRPAHALQKIFMLIRNKTGHDFSFYKRNTVFRRIERRMNSHQIKEFTHYVRYLQENPQEVEQLFKELLIGVTKFFRDQEAYDSLKQHLVPLLQRKPADSTIRVWAPGCSTGEEAYSLVMVLQECLDQVAPNKYLKIQLFATDINQEGVDFARNGLYSENIAGDVSAERLQRFFTKADASYQIRKEVRDVVVFAVHNLNKDAPFTKLDLLVCRNLLIYLSSELQRNLIPVFHYALNPNGLLFLGPSENLTGFQELFTPLDIKWKISQRNNVPYSLARIVNFPFTLARQAAAATTSASMHTPARKDSTFALMVQKLLLGTYAPPSVVINVKGEILYVNGRTGKYLEPAPGMSGMNVLEMAREELRFEISGAVHRATQQRQDVVVEAAKLRTDRGHELVRLTVKYLPQPEALAGLLLVVFEDVPTPRRRPRAGKTDVLRDNAVEALERELQYTKQRLQNTIEEMESSLEELKSTNEELQSANEELQSTNEEAMTNKEEMQSLNEELMTLNMQYLSKTEELSQAANDMKNLLDATGIATIFLDNDMVVKRFTASVGRIIPLQPTDVGRPITHFASKLRYENLEPDVRRVLDRLVPTHANIQTTTGEWYDMHILPYRTLDNYINGAVITFTDITALKELERRTQQSTAMAESVVQAVREPLVVLDAELRVVSLSQAFADMFGIDSAQGRGQLLADLGDGAWKDGRLTDQLQELARTQQAFDNLDVKAEFPRLGRQLLRFYGRSIQLDGHPSSHLLLGISEMPAAQ